MGGQLPAQAQRGGQYEEALRPRAMQVGGLFGDPRIAALMQALFQAGTLQQGAGGFAQAPGGSPTVQVPTFQGPGGTLFDVGTLPPQAQTEPAQPGQVAGPGTVPPAIQGDARAPGRPVSPPPPVPGAPGGAYGGIQMPQWIAQIIGELTGQGPQMQGPQAQGPQGGQGGGGQNVTIGLDLIGDPTGGKGLDFGGGQGGEPGDVTEINPFENLGPGKIGG